MGFNLTVDKKTRKLRSIRLSDWTEKEKTLLGKATAVFRWYSSGAALVLLVIMCWLSTPFSWMSDKVRKSNKSL
jgi:hypothetical protein